jgi:glyoxylase-like metal-dependent hydrolase (beta-lactamase superfamily II)
MIHILDLKFLDNDLTIAAFLIETSAGPVLIETGPHSTFQQLSSEIQRVGFQVEDVKHVFLTHIHLDHAGAAWAFAEMGATVYVHPFGYKHLQNPVKLMESAKRIYQDQMDRLWGEMRLIQEDRLIQVADQEAIQVGDTSIISHHTPGHAVHHIAWQIGDSIFAGDVAGVKIESGIVVPPCPPPDINVEDWQASIQKLKDLNPAAIYLTHFGKITNIEAHLDALEGRLLAWANWMKPHFEAQTDPKIITPLFQKYVQEELIENGVNQEGLAQYEGANPSWMSVAGLLRYWRKRDAK